MEPKKSKYDTNPLDPDFVKNAGDGDAAAQSHTQEVKGVTREIGSTANEEARRNIYSEAPTRRYDNVPLDAPYQSVFMQPSQSQPAQYQPPMSAFVDTKQPPTSRKIPGLGLPEKWAMILPYAPFYIGIVVSLIELFLVPRSEPRVRFHAAQGLALHVAILAIHTVFGIVELFTDNGVAGGLFSLAAIIFLIVSMVRVWKGQPHQIEPLSDAAGWFNKHILAKKNPN